MRNYNAKLRGNRGKPEETKLIFQPTHHPTTHSISR